MRKAISLVLSAIMISSSIVPAFAQKRQASARLTAEQADKTDIISTKELPGRSSPTIKQNPRTETTRFENFHAYTDGNGVWLSWQMAAEVGNIGFYAYRVDKGSVERLHTNKGIIPGAATHGSEVPSHGETYSFFDRDGFSNSAYYVEAVALSGSRVATGQVYPQYVSELNAVIGKTQLELARLPEVAPLRLEDSLLSLTKDLLSEREQTSVAPDPVTHRTVISQPGVARIGVKGEGLYRVTRAQLQAAGFDTTTNPALWQLYIEGNEVAINVGPSGDYIEFYGKGTDTPETDIRRYFLINGATSGKRIGNRVARTSTSTVVWPNYNQTFVKKERITWLDDVINGDAENYWGRGIDVSGSTLNFNLSGVDTNVPTAQLKAKFQGYSTSAHKVEVTLNNQLLGVFDPNAILNDPFSVNITVSTSLLLEGANTIKFRAVDAIDFYFFDQMSIGFARRFVADQNRVSFYTQNSRISKLSGFTSANIRVFDMTNESEPVMMTNLNVIPTGATFGLNLPAARGRVFYAVEDSGLLAPDSVTSNNPELVGDAANAADLVIIAHRSLMPQAQIWANYRIAQGISVKLIDVDELYDEFNYGTFSASAIRSFLQAATQNWSNPPEYALLIGDGSWDSRNYEGLGNFNFIPSKMVSTIYSETASDEALADFNGDGLAEIAIGRIPARTADQMTTAFNKLVQWEGLPLDQWHTRGAVFAYDHDSGYPFAQMSLNLRNQIPMVTNATMVYRGEANANTNVLNGLGTGPFIANYSGHGTAGSWGGSPTFFNVFSVPNVQSSNPSIYTMLTCLNGYFIWLYNPSMAEVLMFTPNKGAVVAWASSGLTTADLQEQMALRFYHKIGDGTIPRVGDLVKDAKTVLVDQSDVRYSWVLLGDPMTKVR